MTAFRQALLRIAPAERDAWVDRQLGIDEILDDDRAALPAGGVPYLPSSVDVLLRTIEKAPIRADDVVIDIGAGAGRAAAILALCTGARVVGLEIQPHLQASARTLAARLPQARLEFLLGDALSQVEALGQGTVFYLYCPFGGERLSQLMSTLDSLAQTKPITIACVDLPLPQMAFLQSEPHPESEICVFRSTHGNGPSSEG